MAHFFLVKIFIFVLRLLKIVEYLCLKMLGYTCSDVKCLELRSKFSKIKELCQDYANMNNT